MGEQKYDLIGDIHGHANELIKLLEHLGYQLSDTGYCHPERKVIFLGDFVDRGALQRGVIELVRPMVEQGHALTVMGNHEFNAIAYHSPDLQGGFLRKHNKKNTLQHKAFLDAYPDKRERSDVIAWFKTLPLWLEFEELNVIHACWDAELMAGIVKQYGSNLLSDGLLYAACNPKNWEYTAIETLLKGKEIRLPEGRYFNDKDGFRRHNIRIRWWDNVNNCRDAFIGPETALTHIPDDPISADHLIEYGHNKPPLFLGHYWLEPPIEPLAVNIACLDYSVAKPGGHLVAYRWDGESTLSSSKFVAVKRHEPVKET